MSSKIQTNNQMSSRELCMIMQTARSDYRHFIRLYRIVTNIYRRNNDKAIYLLQKANRAELTYNMASGMLKDK